MTIPYATTTVSVLRRSVPDGDIDGYPDQEAVYAPVSTGTRAVVTSPIRGVTSGGHTIREGSEQIVDVFKLVADPCDIQHTDRILDETTQIVYRVEWLAPRTGLGLDHMDAGLSFVEGFNL
jgi:hypothetical protein